MIDTKILDSFQQLWSPTGKADPYPNYAVLREHAPVLPIGPRRAMVTGHPECQAILLDPETFPVCDAEWGDRAWPSWRDHPAVGSLYNALMRQNAPHNQPARKLLMKFFRARHVTAMHPLLQRHAAGHVSMLLGHGEGGVPVDAVETLLKLPAVVVCDIFGLPLTDLPMLTRWIASVGKANEFNPPGHDLGAADKDSLAFKEYLRPLARRRKGGDGRDLVTFLASEWPAGDENGLLDTLAFTLGAGTETAASMLGSGLEVLSTRPELIHWLREHPHDRLAFARELLRFHPPAQMVARWTAKPVTIGDVRLPRHTMLMLSLGGAGRDPRYHPQPDRFDPTRFDGSTTPRQVLLTFGSGSHRCPGAALAESLAETVFGQLAHRCDKLTLAGTPQYTTRPVMRGFVHLPVEVTESCPVGGDDSHA